MYQNILVPIAFDDTHDSSGAIKVAKLLADQSAKITLLHVMDEIPSYAITYLPEGYRNQTRDAILADLQTKADTIPGSEIKVVDGHSGATIVDYAKEKGVDCIIIASHRPGIQDFFLGSTAARVVRHAQCAVHVIR